MKEQSHKDEMSRALRGDFERLRERGVPTTLGPPAEPQPDAVMDSVDAPSEDDGDGPKPGWLERLRGR